MQASLPGIQNQRHFLREDVRIDNGTADFTRNQEVHFNESRGELVGNLKTVLPSTDDLLANRQVLNSLAACYRDVFLSWGEKYFIDEVLRKVERDLSGEAMIGLLLKDDTRVVGFCWGQVLSAEGIAQSLEHIHFCRNADQRSLLPVLKSFTKSRKVIYIHDFGVTEEIRGQVYSMRLFFQVMNGMLRAFDIPQILCWTTPDSPVHDILPRIGYQCLGTVQDMVFFRLGSE